MGVTPQGRNRSVVDVPFVWAPRDESNVAVRQGESKSEGIGRHLNNLAIIVVHWQGIADTDACLQSLEAAGAASQQIFLIFNEAHEQTVTRYQRLYPGIQTLAFAHNTGYTGANNRGIELAQSCGFSYYLLLNNDTVVENSLLTALVQSVESDARVGVVGAKILYYDEPSLISSAGGTVSAWGESDQFGLNHPDDGTFDEMMAVDWVSGCCLLVTRRVIESIGMLDERFFAYYEEVDWCRRVRQAGFTVVYQPAARVYHKIQPVQQAERPYYMYLMTRNRLLYLQNAGAGWLLIGRVIMGGYGRQLLSWSLRPRHRERRRFRRVLVRAIWDFVRGQYGPAPAV